MFRVVLFLVMLLSFRVNGSEGAIKEKKYNLSVCAIFKDETKYLKEWIEYHRLVGVDHFYLYNNNSIDRPAVLLTPYIKAGIVTLISWPDTLKNKNDAVWALSTQVSAYENAAKFRAINETKWLVFIDVDEFLLPANAGTLTEILEKYDSCPGVTLSRDFYDASNIDQLSKKKLLIENLKMVGSPKEKICRSVEKTIFKPEFCKCFNWPPFRYTFKDNQVAARVSKYEMHINSYLNRNVRFIDPGKIKEKLLVDQRAISKDEIQDLLEAGYEIEDQEKIIYRYVPALLKKMGYAQFLD